MAKKDVVKYEVKTVEVRKKCTECGKGYITATGKLDFKDPLHFEHKCDKCGAKVWLKQTYPYTEYRYKEFRE